MSSTCYDLGQVRADLKDFFESIGLEPVLSEYDSFPVDPGSVSPVDNCLDVVKGKADIFVLLVGTRYGSLVGDRSVTNLEYLTARAKGIPAFVCVSRQLLSMLPVWERNKGGDFSGIVDSTRIFEFVSGLQQSGDIWIHPFDRAQDITNLMRQQMSFLFMDALLYRAKHRAAKLSPKLSALTGNRLRYVVERPSGWEFLLLSEGLKAELQGAEDVKMDWHHKIGVGTGRAIAGLADLLQFVREKNNQAARIVAAMNTLLNSVAPDALGPTGVAGDPEKILYVSERFGQCYRELLEWKLDYYRTNVPEWAEALKRVASSMLDESVTESERFVDEAVERIKQALTATSPQVISLTLTLTMSHVEEFEVELSTLQKLVDEGGLIL